MTESEVRQVVMDAIGRIDNALANSVIAHLDGGRQEQAGHQGVNASVADKPAWDIGAIVPVVGIARPFEMTLTGTTATFSYCYYQRQMCVVECSNVSSGVLTGTVAATGTVYVGVQITEATGAGTIITGSDLSDVAHASAPADQSTVKLPLYIVTAGAAVLDIRGLIQMGFYA